MVGTAPGCRSCRRRGRSAPRAARCWLPAHQTPEDPSLAGCAPAQSLNKGIPTLTPEFLGGWCAFRAVAGSTAIGLAPDKEQALGRGHGPVAVPQIAPVGRLPLPSSRPGAKKSPLKRSLKPGRRRITAYNSGRPSPRSSLARRRNAGADRPCKIQPPACPLTRPAPPSPGSLPPCVLRTAY